MLKSKLSAPLSFLQAVFHAHLKSGETGAMSQTLERGCKDSHARVNNGVTKNETVKSDKLQIYAFKETSKRWVCIDETWLCEENLFLCGTADRCLRSGVSE